MAQYLSFFYRFCTFFAGFYTRLNKRKKQIEPMSASPKPSVTKAFPKIDTPRLLCTHSSTPFTTRTLPLRLPSGRRRPSRIPTSTAKQRGGGRSKERSSSSQELSSSSLRHKSIKMKRGSKSDPIQRCAFSLFSPN